MNEPINLAQKLALFDERYSPRIVATMNDYKIEVVKVEGEFVWQSHPETDDCFLVLEGEARDRTPRPHGAASEGRVVRRATRRASSRASDEAHVLLVVRQRTPTLGMRPIAT